jgi:hypothetical protein
LDASPELVPLKSMRHGYEKPAFKVRFSPLKDGHEPILLMASYEDIAIIDKKHDLNIYKISEVFDVKDQSIASSTNSPVVSPGCCCGNGKSLKKGDASRIAEIDFNEWVGKLSNLPYLQCLGHLVLKSVLLALKLIFSYGKRKVFRPYISTKKNPLYTLLTKGHHRVV